LIPVSRGIFVTSYFALRDALSQDAATDLLRSFYADSPCIRIRETPPRLVDVVGSNFCDLSIAVRGHQVVVMAALDNLLKGMAGQAVQNMNLMFGLPEESGLLGASPGPV
jgi:N-acetyl-gamma-glutamyl-phosphate reductase